MSSNSIKGKEYIVELLSDGSYICDCLARKECRHIKQVKNLQANKLYDETDY